MIDFGIQYLPSSISEDVASHPDIKTRHYAIIGAGAAGLCAIKYLLQAGASNIACYEIGTKVGGLWCYENDNGLSSAYSCLHINTARTLTRFSHMDLPPETLDFPHHTEMYKYFVDYADKFDLIKYIQFNSRVIDIRRAPAYSHEKPKWQVETHSGQVNEFDAVIVASGHLSHPRHIPMFKNEFGGDYLHSHYYRKPIKYADQKVCIVGGSNSAFDVTADVCTVAEKTVMVARSPVVILPKTVFGIPFRNITLHFDRVFVPAKLRRWVNEFLTLMMHGDMTKLGFKPQTHWQHATSNGTLVNQIKYGRVAVKNGIERIEGKRIFFSDGSSEIFDTLIASTGYKLDLPFFKPDIISTDGDHLNLYQRIAPLDHKGLYFLGYVNTTIALVLMFEHQMKWILEHDSGNCELPVKSEMEQSIKAKKSWIEARYGGSERYSLEEPHVFYFPELKKSIADGKKRRQSRF